MEISGDNCVKLAQPLKSLWSALYFLAAWLHNLIKMGDFDETKARCQLFDKDKNTEISFAKAHIFDAACLSGESFSHKWMKSDLHSVVTQ